MAGPGSGTLVVLENGVASDDEVEEGKAASVVEAEGPAPAFVDNVVSVDDVVAVGSVIVLRAGPAGSVVVASTAAALEVVESDVVLPADCSVKLDWKAILEVAANSDVDDDKAASDADPTSALDVAVDAESDADVLLD